MSNASIVLDYVIFLIIALLDGSRLLFSILLVGFDCGLYYDELLIRLVLRIVAFFGHI